MSDELKPCPHCGNSDYLKVKRVEGETVLPDNFQVVCSWLLGGCGASGGARRTQAEAIAAWNTRADDAPEQPVDNAQADSREKLEADVRRSLGFTVDDVFHWLDRQAAITAKQLTSQSVAPETAETAETDVAKEHMRYFDADSRERLRADVYEGFSAVDLPEQMRDVLRSRVHMWLDRQAAITHAEVFEDGEYDCRTCDAKRELQERVDSLTAECDRLLAELEAYRDFEKGEFAIPLDEAMEFTTDPPGYVKKHIAELQAERDELRGQLDTMRDVAREFRDERDMRCVECGKLREECDRLRYKLRCSGDMNNKLREELRIEREAVDACEGCDKVDELTAELERKQHVCDVQRDSFLKLEAENAELRRMLSDAASAI